MIRRMIAIRKDIAMAFFKREPGATVHLYGKVRLGRARRWASRLRSAQSRQKRLIGAKARIWPLKAAAIGFPPVDILGFACLNPRSRIGLGLSPAFAFTKIPIRSIE